MDFKRDESLQKRKNTGYSDTARIMRRALGVTAMRGSDFDPDGSYTGVQYLRKTRAGCRRFIINA